MSANTVILFNGLGGSGKTACARALFERLGASALLDVDSLTTVEPFFRIDTTHLSVREVAQAVIDLIAEALTLRAT